MTSLIDTFAAPFMQRALIEALLIAVMASAVGVHVVLRRMSFFAEALQHTVFPGIVVAYLFGASLLLGAAVAAAFTIGALALFAARRWADDDAVTAVVLTGFFGLGVLLVSKQSSYKHDLTSLLFGRLLAVDSEIILQTAVVAVAVLAALMLAHKELIFRGFDPDGYAASGGNSSAVDLLLRILISAVVISAVQAVGTVLLIAFLVTPALTARYLTSRISVLFVGAVVISASCAVGGLYLSYRLSLEHGVSTGPAATIVLAMSAIFVLVSLATAATRSLRTSAP